VQSTFYPKLRSRSSSVTRKSSFFPGSSLVVRLDASSVAVVKVTLLELPLSLAFLALAVREGLAALHCQLINTFFLNSLLFTFLLQRATHIVLITHLITRPSRSQNPLQILVYQPTVVVLLTGISSSTRRARSAGEDGTRGRRHRRGRNEGRGAGDGMRRNRSWECV
jgi:hypothetical protein